MRATIDRIVEHTPLLRTYWLSPEVRLRFTPGEYTEMYLPHDNPDNRGEHRKFSIASSPTESTIAITVTFAPANGSSFKAALAVSKPGDTVYISETMGDFVLPKDASIPLVFVAAGAGISPVISMVSWLKAMEQNRAVQIIHSVSDSQTLLERSLLERYATSYTPIVTQPLASWNGETGRLSAERIIQLTGDTRGKRYYIAGPETMADALKKGLATHSIAPENILTDVFLGLTAD